METVETEAREEAVVEVDSLAPVALQGKAARVVTTEPQAQTGRLDAPAVSSSLPCLHLGLTASQAHSYSISVCLLFVCLWAAWMASSPVTGAPMLVPNSCSCAWCQIQPMLNYAILVVSGILVRLGLLGCQSMPTYLFVCLSVCQSVCLFAY